MPVPTLQTNPPSHMMELRGECFLLPIGHQNPGGACGPILEALVPAYYVSTLSACKDQECDPRNGSLLVRCAGETLVATRPPLDTLLIMRCVLVLWGASLPAAALTGRLTAEQLESCYVSETN